MSGELKVLTVRFSADQASELECVARIDGTTVAEAIRDAISGHIASRCADPEFQQRLRERVESDRHILSRLSGQS